MATYVSLKNGSTLSYSAADPWDHHSDRALGHRTYFSPTQPVGKVASKPLISWKDLATLAMVLPCCAGAMGIVYSQDAAVHVGQTYQLVIVGACLAIMAIGSHRQISNMVILYSVSSSRITLQDLQAMLQRDIGTTESSILCRIIILALSVVHLLLSIGYTTCVGGRSIVRAHLDGGDFDLTGRPGYQSPGLGYSLVADTYLPFWINPQTSGSYGFNLLMESNGTSAVLDAPLPRYIVSLQQSLAKDETLTITITVNATVAQDMSLTEIQRNDNTFWGNLSSQFGSDHWLDMDMGFSHHCFLAMGFGNETGRNNNSMAIVSSGWTDRGQTLASEARQVSLTRRECKATWQMTHSNIILIKGQVLETESEARSRHNQSLIDNSVLNVATLFGKFVTEYDWAPWVPRDLRIVNTVPSMVATMLWARQVSQEGCEWEESDPYQDPYHVWGDLNLYHKQSAELGSYRERISLERTGVLLITLLTLPTITIAALCAKLWLYDCPIDDGFGLISVLAAVSPRSLAVVQGAGLSGRLERSVALRFGVTGNHTPRQAEEVEIHLDERGQPPKIHREKLYG